MAGAGSTEREEWRVGIHGAAEAAYERLDLTNRIFPYWTISYIESGEVEVTDGVTVLPARTGQVMIHAPGLPFGERAAGPGIHKWLLLEASNGFGSELFRLFPIREVVTVTDPVRFSALLDTIISIWAEPAALYRELMLNGLGLQLVSVLLQDWEREGRVPREAILNRKDERLDIVLAFLLGNPDRKVTREELAGLVHLNPNYLDRIFAERYGMKPMQMLRDIRLKEARRMLESSDWSLSEIAERCGMGDASYLSRKFARWLGMTPGRYREDVRRLSRSYYGSGAPD